ncbi:heparinase II/III family protein [Paenibacillus sp. OV219]|uniref:heparinase II/III domain-containing protein n=1 Tax=Paenibacillus sp. OV219 TaxID=1884377 RepID=UPI0008BC273D|nr:heparinase II/III family protein [Paenibacillus sp. OV219]SEN49655.1 Heparinase II/III-like protein [Paenibacillus sp. OV219]
MLAEKYVNDTLGDLLHSRDDYKPFPTIEDRNQWDELPPNLREFWINKGVQELNHSWGALTATAYMEYSRTGNRNKYDDASWARRRALGSLVIAECIENQGRFMDDIVNGIWCICEETFWGIPGHGYMMKRQDPLPDVSDQVIELFSAETASLLAWTHYLLQTKLNEVSVMVCERIQLEVKNRILDPFLSRNDLWWMGFNQERMLNNWTPWCNSNCLSVFLLLEDDPERREAAVIKAMRSLDHYIDRLHSDGGCEEGPKYWIYAGGTLFDCLELLYSASDGQISVFDEPKIAQIGRYIYKAYINDSYYVNFADSTPKVQIPAELAYRFGRRIGDDRLSQFGALELKKRREEATHFEFPAMFRVLPALFHYSEIEQYTGESPYIRDAWLDGIQLMVAREQPDSSTGLYLAAKGGHNDESHNHNDIGQFIVYCNGSPMIIDPGVLTYTSKSFFSERYTIWAMQSAYHNVPIINGIGQMNGREYRATDVNYHVDDRAASLSMNIATAYPESAQMNSWIRTIQLIRDVSPYIEIKDEYQLEQVIDDITWNVMTPHPPQMVESGNIILQDEHGNKLIIQYNSEMYAASSEEISLEDEIMRDAWGDHLYRIHLTSITGTKQGDCSIRINQI